MAERVNFAELKQRVSIVDVLAHYGILDSLRARKGGDELVGKCPWHSSSSSDPFRVSVSKNAFRCFGCNAQGNVIGLVETQEELSTRDAACYSCSGGFQALQGAHRAVLHRCRIFLPNQLK